MEKSPLTLKSNAVFSLNSSTGRIELNALVDFAKDENNQISIEASMPWLSIYSSFERVGQINAIIFNIDNIDYFSTLQTNIENFLLEGILPKIDEEEKFLEQEQNQVSLNKLLSLELSIEEVRELLFIIKEAKLLKII